MHNIYADKDSIIIKIIGIVFTQDYCIIIIIIIV